jgi:hypothetical protein
MPTYNFGLIWRGPLLFALCFAWLGVGTVCPASAEENLKHQADVETHAATDSKAANEPVCVVELFTSQGCSSCPPADRLLSTLAHEANKIALTFPIDYWDYMGWKDTLAEPAFTARQKAYAAARGDGHIYTPQAVINGLVDIVGSDRAAIEHAAASYKGYDGALTIPMRLRETDGVLHISIAAGEGGPANVYVLRVIRSHTVVVGRGENSGRNLTYTNVVRAMRKIGEWNGTAQDFSLMELRSNEEGYVVLLQKGSLEKPGAILAAAKTAGY